MVALLPEGKVKALAEEFERAAAELAALAAETGTDPVKTCAYAHAIMLPVKLQQALDKLNEEIARQKGLRDEHRLSAA